jgi:hypothetical protein
LVIVVTQLDGKMREILQDAYDLHIHPSPDIVPRKAMDNELAQAAIRYGMKGIAIKSHYFDTSGRAALIRAVFPDCHAVGGIVLNHSVGGLNPIAVEMLGRCQGPRIVWFPTIDAQNMWDSIVKRGTAVPAGAASTDPAKVVGISILKEGGLSGPVLDILRLIAENDMILATGHLSGEETLALLKEAKRCGVRRMIASHCEFPATYAEVDLQKEYIQCGAFIEHNALNTIHGVFPVERLAEQIRAVGPDHVLLTSDLGQITNPFPLDGFAQYLDATMKAGISAEEIRRMIVTNPARLVA